MDQHLSSAPHRRVEQQRALIFWKSELGIWIDRSIGDGVEVSLLGYRLGLVITVVDS
jgi:hypothetical protein